MAAGPVVSGSGVFQARAKWQDYLLRITAGCCRSQEPSVCAELRQTWCVAAFDGHDGDVALGHAEDWITMLPIDIVSGVTNVSLVG